MAGKKGKSGRKSKYIENLIAEVERLSMVNSIGYLDGTDKREKFALTKELAGKVLARRIKVGGENEGEAIKVEVYIPQNTGRSWAGANGK